MNIGRHGGCGRRGIKSELIHIFAFAMKFAIKAADIRVTVRAFPTYAADIKSMI
jgi:pyruvate/2-oxoglutarate dehydrogenase complex dihydrolipoamide dehydrogenase (E3) component